MHYAKTSDGRNVPILDYTRAEFRHSRPSLFQNLRSLVGLRGLLCLPRGLRHRLARRSELLGNFLLRDVGGSLSGQATYLAKLGPNVPHASRLDKVAAGSVQSIESARRGFSVASLEAQILRELVGGGEKAITFLNIGGGPASDNLNALLLLRAESPEVFALLLERGVQLQLLVLDADDRGAVLGQRSLEALQAPKGPLAGIAIRLERLPYDWSQPRQLESLLKRVTGRLVVCAEGSLFEYGSDTEIAGNWEALVEQTEPPAAVIGTVFRRPGDINLVAKRMLRLSPRMGWKFRGLEPIAELAHTSGWRVDSVDRGNSIYLSFVLRPEREQGLKAPGAGDNGAGSHDA